MKRKLRIFVLLGLLVMTVPFARGLVRPPAAVAERRYENDWEMKVEAQLAAVREGDYDLVFIGDSLTEYWGHEGKQVWDHYYGDRNALNLGVGGDRTENVLWRIDNGELDRLSPKVAVLMIGTNNYAVSEANEISDATLTILDRLEKIWPETEILVVGILPVDLRMNPHRAKMDRVNERTERLLRRRDAHFLNINKNFMQWRHNVRPEYLVDWVHLTEAGYQVWAESMEPTLAGLLGDVPKERLQSDPGLLASTASSPQPS